ncbi:N-acetylmuramoyl-L-alanine amidase [Halotalea alkalilenta]|nr:N-acetylmuramoyl-L-alanine amidase [Halotalea alkalilenta]
MKSLVFSHPSLHRGFMLLALLFCVLVQCFQPAQAAELGNIRTWSQDGTTRVVFDLDDDVDYQVFTLDDPMRLVVDFKNTRVVGDIASAAGNEPLFESVRWGVREGHDLRVVIDLARPVVYSQFPLGPAAGATGSRLVVDLQQGQGNNGDDAVLAAARQQIGVTDADEAQRDPIAAIISQQEANARRQAASPPPSPQIAEATSPTANQGRGRDIVVVIDPGHGGKDPGAIGANGTREKDVVLAIARRLKARFDAAPGFTAKLTRDGDEFIPLRGRTEIARRNHADFFVSIHADAAKSRTPRGSSVYALSQHGATSEAARWLAQSENSADLIGGVDGDLSLNDKDEMLRGVLLDLSMTATVNASLSAGTHLLSQLGRFNRLHKSQVEQAGFVVLKSPDIPSLLVETGFISTPAEEALLGTGAHQDQLAGAIFGGINTYFQQHPPPSTYLAQQIRGGGLASGQYRVRSGDTLSSIAQRQGVTMVELKRANALETDVVRAGQVLHIP